jgi:hypothetical protein
VYKGDNMLDNQSKIVSLMLQIQYIIDEDYEDNEDIQTSFNNLAIALDNVVE